MSLLHALASPHAAFVFFDALVLGLLCIGIASMTIRELSDREIPDNLIYALLILGLFVAVLEPPRHPSMVDALLGGPAMGILFLWIRLIAIWLRGESTIGFQETKFAAVAGVWVGLSQIPAFVLVAALAALAVVATERGMRGNAKRPGSQFSFSPALGAGLLFILIGNAFGIVIAP